MALPAGRVCVRDEATVGDRIAGDGLLEGITTWAGSLCWGITVRSCV